MGQDCSHVRHCFEHASQNHFHVALAGRQGRIFSAYDVDSMPMSMGGFGVVAKAIHRQSGATRAVKAILRSNEQETFEREVAIMKMLHHPNVIQFHESFEEFRALYIVMELCTGGELYDHIEQSRHGLSELDAAVVMRHALLGVSYLHDMRICHRDLKPDNFLFMRPVMSIATATLKLIDFGLAKFLPEGEFFSTTKGTPLYVAPEVIRGKYDSAADIWSLGVMLYVMLSREVPFDGENDGDVLCKILAGRFCFSAKSWDIVSGDAMDLITEMLNFDKSKRITAPQALHHYWLTTMFHQCSLETVEDSSDCLSMRSSFGDGKGLDSPCSTVTDDCETVCLPEDIDDILNFDEESESSQRQQSESSQRQQEVFSVRPSPQHRVVQRWLARETLTELFHQWRALVPDHSRTTVFRPASELDRERKKLLSVETIVTMPGAVLQPCSTKEIDVNSVYVSDCDARAAVHETYFWI